jgi:hypothetical protein
MFSLLIGNIVWIVVGYAVCVLFPVPWLSSAILTFWGAFGSKIMSFFKTVETDVETEVQTSTTATVAPVAPTSTTTGTESAT